MKLSAKYTQPWHIHVTLPQIHALTKLAGALNFVANWHRARITKQESVAKLIYEKHHRDVKYFPGDLVLLYFLLRNVAHSVKGLPEPQESYRVVRET